MLLPRAAGPWSEGAWWKGCRAYQWFVFVVASLGWLFDTMDQQLFNLARKPAVTDLLDTSRGDALAGRSTNTPATPRSIFMIGWAIGGLFFGMLGDRIGRAKTMMLTILLYSAFTGIERAFRGVWDFSFYRFLTGLGVGGEFAVGVSLVAEVMPDRARPFALGWLQALSAVGNMMAAVISMGLGKLEESGAIGSAWRLMFVIGVCPGAPGHPDLPAAQGARTLEGRGARGRATAEPKHKAGFARRTVQRPALAARIRSSACSWRSREWSVSGASASSAST